MKFFVIYILFHTLHPEEYHKKGPALSLNSSRLFKHLHFDGTGTNAEVGKDNCLRMRSKESVTSFGKTKSDLSEGFEEDGTPTATKDVADDVGRLCISFDFFWGYRNQPPMFFLKRLLFASWAQMGISTQHLTWWESHHPNFQARFQ